MSIMIKNFTNSDTAVSYEDGKRCLENEIEELNNNPEIILDFQGISYVITAFLNPVIGDLILKFGPEVMKRVAIRNANPSIIEKIKMVRNGALLKREDLE